MRKLQCHSVNSHSSSCKWLVNREFQRRSGSLSKTLRCHNVGHLFDLFGGGCVWFNSLTCSVCFVALNEQLKETLNECLNDKAQVRLFFPLQGYSLVSQHNCMSLFRSRHNITKPKRKWCVSWVRVFLFGWWWNFDSCLSAVGGWARRRGDSEASRTGGSTTTRHFGGRKGTRWSAQPFVTTAPTHMNRVDFAWHSKF